MRKTISHSRSTKKAFTIIEVSLFLAISGLLIVGVIIGTNSAINRQRYHDSVQSFAEFLRHNYSDAANIQNLDSTQPGRSNRVIYGKLLLFNDPSASSIKTYNVIGDNFIYQQNADTNTISALTTINLAIQPNSEAEFSPPWSAQIQKTSSRQAFTGSILIVRSPISDTIHTYYTPSTSSDLQELTKLLNAQSSQAINFCVFSEDSSFNIFSRHRQNIRIAAQAHNSSAVQTISLNSEDNQCQN